MKVRLWGRGGSSDGIFREVLVKNLTVRMSDVYPIEQAHAEAACTCRVLPTTVLPSTSSRILVFTTGLFDDWNVHYFCGSRVTCYSWYGSI